MLASKRPSAEATVYTNFLILERYRLPDGTPMISYEEPARSPLLNLARLGSLEHIRGGESLHVVLAEVPSGSARVCLTGKGGEGVNPCLGGRIAQGVEAPSGDPVP